MKITLKTKSPVHFIDAANLADYFMIRAIRACGRDELTLKYAAADKRVQLLAYCSDCNFTAEERESILRAFDARPKNRITPTIDERISAIRKLA